jgi:hypothetical protein
VSTPITYAVFIDEYPEFYGLPSTAVGRLLTVASSMLSETTWGDFWSHACSLLVAHRLCLRFNISAAIKSSGMNSPLASIQTVNNRSASPDSLSESSVTSALITGEDPFTADLARTEYGLEFISLMRMVISPCDIVNSERISR